MKHRSWLGAALAVVAVAAQAHPHSETDQQVSLILTEQSVEARVMLVPSKSQGAEVFKLLDLDNDGEASASEMQAFALMVLAQTRLTVGQQPERLEFTAVNRVERSAMEAGSAMIQIMAKANTPSNAGSEADVHFSISFNDLSHNWFVQPWVEQGDLKPGQLPTIKRSEDQASIAILW